MFVFFLVGLGNIDVVKHGQGLVVFAQTDNVFADFDAALAAEPVLQVGCFLNTHAVLNVVWKMDVDAGQVIASIDAKTNTFYVLDPANGKRADIGVVRESGKAPYVRTYADGQWNNNLLSLNQCPLN